MNMFTSEINPLNEEQIAEYYREGYILVRNLVPHEAIDSVMEAYQLEPVEKVKIWKTIRFQHEEPMLRNEVHRLLVEPHVVGAAEQLMEARARVYFGMLAVVQANGGKGLPWHQDNQYKPVLGRELNVFIALDDITEDMANLWVAPRTHHHGAMPAERKGGDGYDSWYSVTKDEPTNGICLPDLKKGDAAIFDRNTFHRSLVNNTERNRYAYAAQFEEEKARVADTGLRNPLNPLASELRKKWQAQPIGS